MKIKIIYILCILLTTQVSYSMTNDTLTKAQYDSIKQKLLKEIGRGSQHWEDGAPRELRLNKSEINLPVVSTPLSNSVASIAAPNPNDNTPQTYGPYPDNDPSPVVTDLCTDGTFENSNFYNFSWNLVPNNRVFEGDDNNQYDGLTFNTNAKIKIITSDSAVDSSGWLHQSASGFLWGADADYWSYNVWKLTDTSKQAYDTFFPPPSNPVALAPYKGIRTTFSGKKALKLGSEKTYTHWLSAETISKKIAVTTQQFVLTFKYALIYEENNGGHGPGNPFFGVRVYNNTSNDFEYLSMGPIYKINGTEEYWFTNPLSMRIGANNLYQNVFYKGGFFGKDPNVHGADWRCGYVDLSQYIGKTINLEFVVGDCYQGGHFGYAYIDDICVTDYCWGGSDVQITNVSQPNCGANVTISGKYEKPEDPTKSTPSNKVYLPLVKLSIALYKNGLEIKKINIPFIYIKDYISMGTFSIKSSLFYDSIYPFLSLANGLNSFDLVAEANFGIGNPVLSRINGFLPNNSTNDPNDWSYCCDYSSGLKNTKDSFDIPTTNTCNMKISFDKDSIDFPPANKYNYFISKSKLYDELLKNKFNFMNSSGFVPNDPSKIDSFNYIQIAQDYDCKNETQWYEVTYKHPICPYYTKLKVETTCKVPLSCDNVTCEKKDSITLNPYLTNLMGNWRPAESYVYNIKRKAETQNVRKGEYFENRFVPAYDYNGTRWEKISSNNLVRNDRILNYDDAGNPVENKNPLNIYSTKKYAYKNALTHLAASNAKFEECMYYSFESLDHNDNHLEFRIPDGIISNPFYEKINKATGSLSTEAAHTGNYSYKVMKLGTVSNTDTPYVSTLEFFCGAPSDDATPNYKINANVTQVRANDNSFKPVFDLKPGLEYTLSYWTKNLDQTETALGYIGRSYECKTVDKRVLSSTITQPIEGWYHVTENFTVPVTAKLLKLVFYPNNTGSYFDDIRIFPSEANMKSYVYNTQNKMTAELDENNYATFFDYDDEGNLIRVRKETERGIMTLKENRLNLKQR